MATLNSILASCFPCCSFSKDKLFDENYSGGRKCGQNFDNQSNNLDFMLWRTTQQLWLKIDTLFWKARYVALKIASGMVSITSLSGYALLSSIMCQNGVMHYLLYGMLKDALHSFGKIAPYNFSFLLPLHNMQYVCTYTFDSQRERSQVSAVVPLGKFRDFFSRIFQANFKHSEKPNWRDEAWKNSQISIKSSHFRSQNTEFKFRTKKMSNFKLRNI